MLNSRMIRVYLLSLVVLVFVAAAHLGLSWWIAARSVELAREALEVPGVLEQIADAAGTAAAVGGAVATITTALIARYGAREATRNLSSGGSGGE